MGSLPMWPENADTYSDTSHTSTQENPAHQVRNLLYPSSVFARFDEQSKGSCRQNSFLVALSPRPANCQPSVLFLQGYATAALGSRLAQTKVKMPRMLASLLFLCFLVSRIDFHLVYSFQTGRFFSQNSPD
jgi:hypothetical protein